MRKAFALLVLLVIAPSLALEEGGTEANQMRVTSAVINQFETVSYSRANLLSSRNAESKYSTSALQAPFGYLLGALDSLGKGSSTEFLAHSEAVVLGAKDFRPPSGLGSVRSTSCYVMVLGKQNGFDLRQYFSMPPKATKAGRIWAWTAKLGEFGERDPRNSSLFATQVGQSYVLVCNDAGEIETLSLQLNSSEYSVVRSVGFPPWSVLQHDEMWCYRQYRHSGTVNTVAAGVKDVTLSAQALMLVVDFEKKVARLRLFATDDSTPEQINTSMMKANVAWPKLLRSATGSGMWEATIPLSSDQRTGESMFDIAGLFGFGIYL